MSAFKQRLAKLGARAGLLAGASAAVLAISGVTASSALAAPECITVANKAERNLQGLGASLQRSSQQLWTGREVPTVLGEKTPPFKALTGGYAGTCNGAEHGTVSYTSTGSGRGLKAFRFTTSKPNSPTSAPMTRRPKNRSNTPTKKRAAPNRRSSRSRRPRSRSWSTSRPAARSPAASPGKT
jgi:hypothetical protein